MFLLASILGCDLGNVNEEIARVEPYVDGLHFDIADGHFTPEVTFGEPLLKSLKTTLPVDVHLMVTNPGRHIESVIASMTEIQERPMSTEDEKTRFLGEAPRSGEGVQTPSGLSTSHPESSSGQALPKGRMFTPPLRTEETSPDSRFSSVVSITFHIETDEDPFENLRRIKEAGLRAGIAIKAETPVEALELVIAEADYVVLMTIVSGFSGNPFLSKPLKKIPWIRAKNPRTRIIVDGGVNGKTIVDVRAAGADGVISGSYLFRSKDPKEAAAILRGEVGMFAA